MTDQGSLLSQTWTDILPPVAPEPAAWWWVTISVLLLLLVLLVVFVLRRQAPRQRARRLIQACRHRLQETGIDTRQLAARVYLTLLEGLALSPATAHRFPGADWQRFYLALQQSAFGSRAPTSAELAMLIAEARYWLQHYPR